MLPLTTSHSNAIPPTSGYSPHHYGAAVPRTKNLATFHGTASLASQGFRKGTAAVIQEFKLRKGFSGFASTELCYLLAVFWFPVGMFAAVYGAVSFYFRYNFEWFAWLLVILLLCVVVCVGIWVAGLLTREPEDQDQHDHDHLQGGKPLDKGRQIALAAALFLGLLVGFLVALGLGWRNYDNYVEPYYEWKALNRYNKVDPSNMQGRAFMDAGSVQFTPGSHLDITKSAGFMNADMYCVAPIVSATANGTTYDFWAVGRNCCTGASKDFHCGDIEGVKLGDDPGGLRLMSDNELEFYKLAVAQAVSKYMIRSDHPIFVHWFQDSRKALRDYWGTGVENFLLSLGLFAAFQLTVTLFAAFGVVYAKSKSSEVV